MLYCNIEFCWPVVCLGDFVYLMRSLNQQPVTPAASGVGAALAPAPVDPWANRGSIVVAPGLRKAPLLHADSGASAASSSRSLLGSTRSLGLPQWRSNQRLKPPFSSVEVCVRCPITRARFLTLVCCRLLMSQRSRPFLRLPHVTQARQKEPRHLSRRGRA